jgi:hypothetical protein
VSRDTAQITQAHYKHLAELAINDFLALRRGGKKGEGAAREIAANRIGRLMVKAINRSSETRWAA